MSIFSVFKAAVKTVANSITRTVKNQFTKQIKNIPYIGRKYTKLDKAKHSNKNNIKPVKNANKYSVNKNNLTDINKVNRTNQEIKENIKNSADYNRRMTQMRLNRFKKAKLTETQLAIKKSGGNPQLTNEQRLARAEADFFYSATRELWLGGSEAMRNENIVNAMRGLKLKNGKTVQNLEDAFQYVKEQNEGKFPTLDNLDNFDIEEQETRQGSDKPISLSEWRAWGASL